MTKDPRPIDGDAPTLALYQQGGKKLPWTAAIGKQVAAVEVIPHSARLILQLSQLSSADAGQIWISAPWTLTSCLGSTSSSQSKRDDGSKPDQLDWTGLQGAKVTGIEEDNNRLDLILGSIRISMRKE